MRKWFRRFYACVLVAVCFWFGTLFSDRQQLNTDLIRFSVIPASDSWVDQELKIQVRDAVLSSIRSGLKGVADLNAAREYLADNLARLEEIANDVLRASGSPWSAQITFSREGQDAWCHGTVTLPAGLYQTLRITIGDGDGDGLWSVIFPTFQPGDEEPQANQSGLQKILIEGKLDKIRFLGLDMLGKLEKMLAGGEIRPC